MPIRDTDSGSDPVTFTHRQILVIFAGLMASLFLAALDQTIVATALPTIVGELGGLDYYSWVVTAYLLSSTVCTPLYGKLSDMYGRRAVLQTAVGVFLAGSVLAGVAQTMPQLVTFRGVQGMGAAGLMTMTFAVIGDVVSPRQRGRYIGLLAGVWAFASVIGPLIGGFLVDRASWRWVFLINLPIGLAALVVISSVLHLPTVRRSHRIDVEGAVLLVISVTSLLLLLVWGGTEYPWSSLMITGLALTGAVTAVAFVVWEARGAVEPILPMHLFTNTMFSLCSAMGIVSGAALFGAVIFLPLFLQVAAGLSATNSGLLLLPLTAGIVTASVGSGRIISHTGRYRVWPIGGLAMATVGMALLSVMRSDTPLVLSSLYMVVLGLGIGAVMQVTLLVVQNSVDHRELGVATSAIQFFRQMGGSFGVAVFGAIMNARLETDLPKLIPPAALAQVGGDVNSLLNSPAAIRALPPEVSAGIALSVELAVQAVFRWSVPLMFFGFVLAWFLREIPLRETVGPSAQVEGVAESLMLEEESSDIGPEEAPVQR
jgi:EmrB/QacA subfamily drug resistance transporter